MNPRRMIGIVGGMGPAAGIDLFEKIVRATRARSDSEHLPVVMMSYPAAIPDRSAFLLGQGGTNPADAIYEVIRDLENVGASVVGIPCNTAHAPAILDVVMGLLADSGAAVTLVNMIESVVKHIQEMFAGGACIGVLSTAAVRELQIYARPLSEAGYKVIHPSTEVQDQLVTTAIFSRDYGLKAINPATVRACDNVSRAIEHLAARGANAVVLGCTELPLAVAGEEFGGTPLLDPTTLLARRLIEKTSPEMLAP